MLAIKCRLIFHLERYYSQKTPNLSLSVGAELLAGTKFVQSFSSPSYLKSLQVSANLVEPGENALVLHSGYFGDSFADWCVFNSLDYLSCPNRTSSLDTYGATVTQIKAPIGSTVPLTDIEKALKEKKYKVLTFTHVDTSTGTFVPCE